MYEKIVSQFAISFLKTEYNSHCYKVEEGRREDRVGGREGGRGRLSKLREPISLLGRDTNFIDPFSELAPHIQSSRQSTDAAIDDFKKHSHRREKLRPVTDTHLVSVIYRCIAGC